MDYKFLDKVLDQIVSETMIDYDEGRMYTPFTSLHLQFSPFSLFPHYTIFPLFSKHCKNIYGLNINEVSYVWNEYKTIIKDKINNG